MSYFLADSTGPLVDEFTNIRGLADFSAWARRQGKPLSDFVRKGWTEDTKELVDALVKATPPANIRPQVRLLVTCARKAKDILIVTDGMSDDNIVDAEELRVNTARPRSEAALHAAADKHLTKLKLVISYAFLSGRKTVDRAALRRATTASELAVAMAPAANAVQDSLRDVLPATLRKLVAEGGDTAADLLKTRGYGLRSSASSPKNGAALTLTGPAFGSPGLRGELRVAGPGPTKFRFDAKNPRAAQWAREHGAQLAENLSKTSREQIQEAIAGAFEGDGIDYDAILDAVGDEARADVIARTEAMIAVNQGQREAWQQAIDEGVLPANIDRTWIATVGACSECDDLDNEVTTLSEPYSGNGGEGPPLHPNCRCTEGIVG